MDAPKILGRSCSQGKEKVNARFARGCPPRPPRPLPVQAALDDSTHHFGLALLSACSVLHGCSTGRRISNTNADPGWVSYFGGVRSTQTSVYRFQDFLLSFKYQPTCIVTLHVSYQVSCTVGVPLKGGVVSEHITTLSREAALFIPRNECNSPVAPSDIDFGRHISGYCLTRAAISRDLYCIV